MSSTIEAPPLVYICPICAAIAQVLTPDPFSPHYSKSFFPFIMRSLLHSQSLSPSELARFSTVSQGIAIQPAFDLVHRAFEDKAHSQASDVAVEHDGQTITYGELDRKANLLANHLIVQGLKPGEKVCLVAQRSIPMVVGIFAILKAGCQYVPLDGGVVPELFLSHVVANTKATVVLCLQRYFEKVKVCRPFHGF